MAAVLLDGPFGKTQHAFWAIPLVADVDRTSGIYGISVCIQQSQCVVAKYSHVLPLARHGMFSDNVPIKTENFHQHRLTILGVMGSLLRCARIYRKVLEYTLRTQNLTEFF